MQNLKVLSPKVKCAMELKRRRLARENLIDFTRYTHGNYRPSDIHYEIAEALEKVEENKIKRLMVFMPPRHGKSELTSRRFPAFFLGRNPLRDYISAAYNKQMADGFGRDVRNIIDSQRFQNLFPGITLAADSSGKGRFHTSRGGGYLSAGIGTSMTGHGGHVIGIDDPIKDREAAVSKLNKDRIYNWYSSTVYTRLETELAGEELDELWANPLGGVENGLLEPFDGAVIITMTRWDVDDLAGRLLDDMDNGADQWTIINRPATDEAFSFALWPEKRPVSKLKEMKKVMTSRDWDSVIMQSPKSLEGGAVKKAWIKYGYPKSPQATAQGVDLAISEKDTKNNAFTAIVTLQRDLDGCIYITGAERKKCTFHNILKFIDDQAERWEPGRIGIEKVQFQDAVIQEKLRTTNLPVIGCDTGGKDKLVRFIPLQDRFEMGYVYLSPDLPDWFEDELLQFPEGPFKDAVDAAVYAFRVMPNAQATKTKSTNEKREFSDNHKISRSSGWGTVK